MYRVNFKKEDYPGYNNKRRAGLKCDEPFHLGECSSFIFGFYRARKRAMSYGGFTNKIPQPVQEIPIQMQKHETPSDLRFPNAKSATGMNEFPAWAKFDGSGVGYSVRCKRRALMSNIQREIARFHNGCFSDSNKTLGRVGEDVGYLLPKSLILCERYIAELPGFQRENERSLYPMNERHSRGTLRSAELPRIRLGFSCQL
ncbi:hypothetical protein WN944_002316 [Citrus x changshan-huyou]|uniref:Uncharacterized protein n=1 Tax=Citrus x changshan-huyou TaxID=2935761 RepID=A0AAP0MGC2_9ROSI